MPYKIIVILQFYRSLFYLKCEGDMLNQKESQKNSVSGLISLSIYRIHTQKYLNILGSNFITNMNICKYILQNIFE